MRSQQRIVKKHMFIQMAHLRNHEFQEKIQGLDTHVGKEFEEVRAHHPQSCAHINVPISIISSHGLVNQKP